jgi:hypothetical protein
MRKNKVKKGFAFKPDVEYIKQTMDMPVRSKLEWLEEMNSFVYKALSKRKIKAWERIKKGDV